MRVNSIPQKERIIPQRITIELENTIGSLIARVCQLIDDMRDKKDLDDNMRDKESLVLIPQRERSFPQRVIIELENIIRSLIARA